MKLFRKFGRERDEESAKKRKIDMMKEKLDGKRTKRQSERDRVKERNKGKEMEKKEVHWRKREENFTEMDKEEF